MLKIDMHTHILPRKLPRFAEKFGYGDFVSLTSRDDGAADMIKGKEYFRTIQPNCWDEQIRMAEYETHAAQVQVVCTIPVMFSYWAKPNHCLELSQFLNDHIIDLCMRYPKNYVGLGTVPMQDAGMAIEELERIKAAGMVGIQIGSNVNDKNLSEEEFFPIFEACQQLDLAVMIHPWEMMGMDSMKKYWLPWLVGMPAETSRAACSLIFGGVHERLPGLRVCYSHAGGAFIGTIGRMEHGFNCRPDLVAIDNPINPRLYLGKFWVDCITHDEKALKYIIEHVGSDKVCLGSDYPFPLGDLTIGEFIEKGDFDQKTKQDIFHNSTLDWLKLNKERFV